MVVGGKRGPTNQTAHHARNKTTNHKATAAHGDSPSAVGVHCHAIRCAYMQLFNVQRCCNNLLYLSFHTISQHGHLEFVLPSLLTSHPHLLHFMPAANHRRFPSSNGHCQMRASNPQTEIRNMQEHATCKDISRCQSLSTIYNHSYVISCNQRMMIADMGHATVRHARAIIQSTKHCSENINSHMQHEQVN